jgi:hypothetical protein
MEGNIIEFNDIYIKIQHNLLSLRLDKDGNNIYMLSAKLINKSINNQIIFINLM